jgi:transglutaminase-like putative cysteine protease
MLSSELKTFARRAWETALESFGPLQKPLAARMEQTSGDEKALLQLAYGTLPLQDAGSADFALLQSFVRHALRLRRESPFCRDVPEDIFLHFVFYPRVNSENLTDCRPFFYEQLAGRVAGLAGEAAILEVNRWCGENMTYQSTDERTQSPLTSYNCGLGRCGEESVLAVTALRSVGIPARQIYAPLWAHCDDNHAWVEAYSGGRWYFFGACEPEPILNRGWFSDASSRAPLACYRTFFDFRGPCLAADEQTERQGAALLYNVTEHYALTTRLTVRAVTADGRPAPGAKIRADVFNMAALRPVLQNETDARGEFSVRLGRGSYHLEAADADLHAETEILLKDEPLDVTLTLLEHEDTEQVRDVDFSAPAASPVNRTVLTRGQQLESSETLARCAAMRLARLAGCWKPEYASFGPELEAILRAAGKNAAELYDFYAAQQAADRPLALALLQSLAPKDWRDVSRAVLEDHFAARAAQSEHFVGEVLCPRVGHEMLEPWRAAVREAFPGGGAYAGDPQRLMEEIRERFPDGPGRYYAPLWLTPLAALRCGHADETGRRVLFVAAMRAAGLPARLNPADGAAEYWAGGAYHTVCGVHEAKNSGLIVLRPQKNERFVYETNYTLSRWADGGWRLLDYSGASGERLSDPLRIPSLPGQYRLVTIRRLPNGGQLCRLHDFVLAAGQTREIPLLAREASAEQMLSRNALDPFSLRGPDGRETPCGELLRGKTVLVWLDPGKEPTEHILNEFLAAADELRGMALPVVFVLQDKKALENPTLARVLAALPDIRVAYDDFDATATMLARKMFLEPGVWPLLVLADERLRGYYGSCGYRVGLVELTLQLARVKAD